MHKKVVHSNNHLDHSKEANLVFKWPLRVMNKTMTAIYTSPSYRPKSRILSSLEANLPVPWAKLLFPETSIHSSRMTRSSFTCLVLLLLLLWHLCYAMAVEVGIPPCRPSPVQIGHWNGRKIKIGLKFNFPENYVQYTHWALIITMVVKGGWWLNVLNERF